VIFICPKLTTTRWIEWYASVKHTECERCHTYCCRKGSKRCLVNALAWSICSRISYPMDLWISYNNFPLIPNIMTHYTASRIQVQVSWWIFYYYFKKAFERVGKQKIDFLMKKKPKWKNEMYPTLMRSFSLRWVASRTHFYFLFSENPETLKSQFSRKIIATKI
jgi:hypothetical protein